MNDKLNAITDTDIDWNKWVPDELATLVFVKDGDNLLLIHKKRGLGMGKINAPGGKLEEDETLKECALRELKEEVGIEAKKITWVGDNKFHFQSGYSLFVHVYLATEYTGTPIETDEAKPFWSHKDSIPYDKMWEDDILWIPLMLSGVKFSGRFVFNDDKMMSSEIDILK